MFFEILDQNIILFFDKYGRRGWPQHTRGIRCSPSAHAQGRYATPGGYAPLEYSAMGGWGGVWYGFGCLDSWPLCLPVEKLGCPNNSLVLGQHWTLHTRTKRPITAIEEFPIRFISAAYSDSLIGLSSQRIFNFLSNCHSSLCSFSLCFKRILFDPWCLKSAMCSDPESSQIGTIRLHTPSIFL